MKINAPVIPPFMLKVFRLALLYTQGQMAKALGLELPHYKAIEQARCIFPKYARDGLNSLLEPLQAANLRLSYTSAYLKETRLALGLSMRKMAKFIGVAPSTWSSWESGLSIPRNKRYLLWKLVNAK